MGILEFHDEHDAAKKRLAGQGLAEVGQHFYFSRCVDALIDRGARDACALLALMDTEQAAQIFRTLKAKEDCGDKEAAKIVARAQVLELKCAREPLEPETISELGIVFP